MCKDIPICLYCIDRQSILQSKTTDSVTWCRIYYRMWPTCVAAFPPTPTSGKPEVCLRVRRRTNQSSRSKFPFSFFLKREMRTSALGLAQSQCSLMIDVGYQTNTIANDVTSALVSFPPGSVSLYHKSHPLSTAAAITRRRM